MARVFFITWKKSDSWWCMDNVVMVRVVAFWLSGAYVPGINNKIVKTNLKVKKYLRQHTCSCIACAWKVSWIKDECLVLGMENKIQCSKKAFFLNINFMFLHRPHNLSYVHKKLYVNTEYKHSECNFFGFFYIRNNICFSTRSICSWEPIWISVL